MMMRNESKNEEHQHQHQRRREGGRAAGEMRAAFLGEKEKNLTTTGLDDDGNRYNRHRDRSERFDLSSK